MIYLYHINPGYTKATAWSGDPISGQRHGIHTCTPNHGLTRRQRYNAISQWLIERKILPPVYKP